MAADIISSTTQQFLDIHDIVNNFIIMKDGTVSVVITVDAMNFGLLAEEEQDAVMYAYAGLLNSLNYTVQIVINSQTKDVTSYLQLLKDQEVGASNETIRRRIKEYREFVTNLIHDRNVLDKKFYVVIPANSIELGFAGAKSVLPGSSKFDITSIERSILLEKAQNILDPRRDHLIAQFARIGLFSRQLTTQEIIQLFYIRYNPEAAEGQQIGESSSYASPLVQASIQGSVMNTDTVVPPTIGGVMPPADEQAVPATPSAAALPSDPAPDTTPAMPAATDQTTWQPPTPPATPLPTETTPGTSGPLATATAASAETPIPPINPPLTTSAPPVQSMSETPLGAPAASVTASVEVPANETDVQANLDATIQQLGVTPTEAPASPTADTQSDVASTPADQNPSGNLPPLPEI